MLEKKTLLKRPTRESELDAWFARHRIKKIAAAKALGISGQRLGQLLRGIYLTPEWRSRLIGELGVPDHLLPHAKDHK